MTARSIQVDATDLVRESPVRCRIPRTGAMRVPGVVLASDALLSDITEDRSYQQIANVAALPGIVEASYAMPDMHWGYGFPIGGVAATDVDAGGVVSPGGVGFDISCGVRLLAAPLSRDELADADLGAILDRLDAAIPRGLGPGAVRDDLDRAELDRVLAGGAAHLVETGAGREGDLERCEDGGRSHHADPSAVSGRARARGSEQLGSLGSGNHFLELQVVDQVRDPEVARVFGIAEDQVVVMIHCGSRGLGHQVCEDHVAEMREAAARHRITLPDDQLACAPVTSPEGRAYLGAMAAAANYGMANRHVLAERTREAFGAATGAPDLRLVYDVSHNLAKLEEHPVDGASRRLCVQRKGATRALPPGHADLPDDLRPVGQPVLVPGSMGTASHVLVGVPEPNAFHSCAHGAGRTMSRGAARRRRDGAELRGELEAAGIRVRALSEPDLPEEAPAAYKDVDEVVAVCERASLARRVARLRPLGVVKG